jgi:hypothetical protein
MVGRFFGSFGGETMVLGSYRLPFSAYRFDQSL